MSKSSFQTQIDHFVQQLTHLSSSPFTLGGIYGVFRQEPIRFVYPELEPEYISEINQYLGYRKGGYRSAPRYPVCFPDKIQPALIKRHLNRIEAFYPFFTREPKIDQRGNLVQNIGITQKIDKRINIQGNGNQLSNINNNTQDSQSVVINASPLSKHEDFRRKYQEVAKQILDILFDDIDAAKRTLCLPTHLNDPLVIWWSLLFQLAWARIPDSGLRTSNSANKDDTFQTLWPQDYSGIQHIIKDTPEFAGRKLYLPYEIHGVFWSIDAMEGELSINDKSQKVRLDFSPPLSLYIPADGSDEVTTDQAYFPFAWSGSDTDSPVIKIRFTERSDTSEHEIVRAQLFNRKYSYCFIESIRQLFCEQKPVDQYSGTFLCSVHEIHRSQGNGEDISIIRHENMEATLDVFFYRNAGVMDDENRIGEGQEVGLLVDLDIPESVVHHSDFFDPRKVWQRPKKQPLSWLNKTQPGFSTDFLPLQDAERIIESIRVGEDYQKERYEKYWSCRKKAEELRRNRRRNNGWYNGLR